MPRRTSLYASAAALLLLPAQLIAGGPPWLCLPIAGVTAESAKACHELLATKLADKLWQHDGPYGGVQLRPDGDQWYLMFSLGKDIGLREVEAALKGSDFSIPRDRLRLFGHVILEIDARQASPEELLANLKELDYAAVADSENKESRMLVTLDMPYPVGKDGKPERETIGWDTFQRNDLASDPSTRSESPATPRMLPSYAAVRDVVAKHDGSLKDIRWSTDFACRPLGGVVVPDSDTAISATRTKRFAQRSVEPSDVLTSERRKLI